MARWICPNCNATMNAPANLLGSNRACVKCGVVSEVMDADAVDEFSFAAPAVQTHGMPVSAVTVSRIKTEAPALIKVYRLVAVCLTLAICLTSLAIYLRLSPKTPAEWAVVVGPPAVALAGLAFFWLLTDFLSDVFRCRRLLEEIAKK